MIGVRCIAEVKDGGQWGTIGGECSEKVVQNMKENGIGMVIRVICSLKDNDVVMTMVNNDT